MKIKFKCASKILSLLLALVMVVGMLPMMSMTAHASASSSTDLYGGTLTMQYGYCSKCGGTEENVRSLAIRGVEVKGSIITVNFEYKTSHGSCNGGYTQDTATIPSFYCTNNYKNRTVKSDGGEWLSFTRSAGHSVSSWTSSNNKHTGTCDFCHNTVTGNCSGGTATCISKAVCSTCKNEYGSFNDNSHIWSEWNTENGIHSRTCTRDCGKTESAACSGGTPTCTLQAECEVCHAVYGEPTGHSAGAEGDRKATCIDKAFCSVCNSEYGEVDASNHVNDVDDKGIYDCCGGYEPAALVDGVYQISNLGQLMWFSRNVHTSHSAVLTADITIDNSVVWTPIALNDGADNGSTFNGNGHTITFANTREGSTFGLFARYNYSVIENLYLAGSISCNTESNVGVLVNSAYRTTIRKVVSTCDITNAATAGSVGGLAGQFGGQNGGGLYSLIENCAVYADVNGSNNAGGIIGYIWSGYQYCTVQNCIYVGDATGASNSGAIVGANGNASSTTSYFTNIYFCEKNGSGWIGRVGSGQTSVTNVEPVTAEQLASGEVAYLLGDAFGQTLGEDSYPTLGGAKVYYGYDSCDDLDAFYTNNENVFETIPDHSYEAQVKAPDCENGGYTVYTCTGCGDKYTSDYTDALGHSYEVQVIAPDCENGGYTIYNCTECGYIYISDYTDALGHSYEVQVIAPDCVNYGYTFYSCTECGACCLEDVVDALGHSYEAQVTAPDCENGGYTVYTCTECGDSYVADETESLGHSYEDGICSSCGAECEHNYVEGVCASCGMEEAKPCGSGDLNDDGKVNTMDINIMRRLISGNFEATDEQLREADLNGDGKVNTIDANLLSQKLAGVE